MMIAVVININPTNVALRAIKVTLVLIVLVVAKFLRVMAQKTPATHMARNPGNP